jgi:endonuclease YncB( thermonuclease family)
MIAALAASALALAPRVRAPVAAQSAAAARKAAAEWVDVERVVDGDTIHVRRNGRIEKLRLLSVDTEERLGPGHAGSATKPQTVFGEDCALWAENLFAGLGKDGQPARVGLVFPGGAEKRDVYGRLLCHVLLPDGTDYDLMLVQLGKSPYFNKYGEDPLDPAAFAAAQRAARAAKLGIWNPATNEPKTPGAPAAKRPYAELLAWWNARAQAVESFRHRAASTPDRVADAEDPATLERAAAARSEVEAFGEVERLFVEKNGDRTVLFRTSEKRDALRVVVPAEHAGEYEALDLEALTREFRQNYAWVRGTVRRSAHGYEMRSEGPDRWHRAGPEPALPPPGSRRPP